eukprot:GHVU01214825.1.p1 GENE.GHVU01214825.1~~GHVU01214825.1.p1  ORF type:complete len:184 (+),score=47.60 GHVU01214825.1:343-894(+)
MGDLDDVVHSKLTYVFVPMDMADEMEERQYSGSERGFKEILTNHFGQNKMTAKESKELQKSISEQAKDKVAPQVMKTAMEASQSYEIVPLVTPKSGSFDCINAYIDSVGRVKNLPTNARATRVASTDMRGDCIVSKTYDDEETFKRVDFTKKDFEEMLRNPPDASGRWNQANALQQLLAKAKQ